MFLGGSFVAFVPGATRPPKQTPLRLVACLQLQDDEQVERDKGRGPDVDLGLAFSPPPFSPPLSNSCTYESSKVEELRPSILPNLVISGPVLWYYYPGISRRVGSVGFCASADGRVISTQAGTRLGVVESTICVPRQLTQCIAIRDGGFVGVMQVLLLHEPNDVYGLLRRRCV